MRFINLNPKAKRLKPMINCRTLTDGRGIKDESAKSPNNNETTKPHARIFIRRMVSLGTVYLSKKDVGRAIILTLLNNKRMLYKRQLSKRMIISFKPYRFLSSYIMYNLNGLLGSINSKSSTIQDILITCGM